jgi:F-box and WD-40 domain protein 1/11
MYNHRIASIDFSPPFVISGSSDKHLRLFDITTLQGWSTSPDFDNPPSSFLDSMSISSVGGSSVGVSSTMICHVCGSMAAGPGQGNAAGGEASGSAMDRIRCVHADLVRSVALGDEFVLSGSYDLSIKVRISFISCSFFTHDLFGALMDPIHLGVGEVDWETRRRSHGWTYRSDILYRF